MGKLTKSAVIVFLILFISKILGVIKEAALANNFGTSYILDAYLMACTLPTVLSAFLYKGIPMAYIPVYSRINGEEERRRFFSNTLCMVAAISMVGSIVVFGFPETVVRLLAPGFSGAVFELAACLVQFVAVYFPINAIFELLCAQSAVNEEFIFANFCNSIVANLILIMFVMIAGITTPIVLGYGNIISISIPAVLLGMNLSSKGYSFHWRFCLQDSSVICLIRTAIPEAISFMVNQLNSVVDKMFSSTFGEGSVSALSYAERLQLLPYTMIVSVVLTVCSPRMNRCFSEHNSEEGMYYVKRAVCFSLFVSIPVFLYMFNFSESIVSLLFERGRFDRDSVLITSQCLVFYSIGIPFYSLRQIASNVLSANMKQRIVLKNTIIAIMINIVLDYYFARLFGLSGLAMATSLTGIIANFMMLYDLERMGMHLLDKDTCKDIIKIIICASISILLGIKFLVSALGGSSFCSLVSLMGTISAIYVVLCILGKEFVISMLLRNVKGRINTFL